MDSMADTRDSLTTRAEGQTNPTCRGHVVPANGGQFQPSYANDPGGARQHGACGTQVPDEVSGWNGCDRTRRQAQASPFSWSSTVISGGRRSAFAKRATATAASTAASRSCGMPPVTNRGGGLLS